MQGAKRVTVVLFFWAAMMAIVFVPAAQSGESKNIKIDARDSTAEWATLYDRGVETGKRLNSFCEGSDYVKTQVLGEEFTVCRK